MSNEYSCAKCGEVFTKTRSDEDAYREYEQTHPQSVARGDETSVVCDDCFTAYMAWAKETGQPL